MKKRNTYCFLREYRGGKGNVALAEALDRSESTFREI